MDYLLYCTGECDDAMRDRDFYLVKNVHNTQEARELLDDWFRREERSDDASYYDVFVKGENIEDAMCGVTHWNYRFTTV